MATGKWISELTGATPLADAALRVLDLRLGVVRDFLGLALRESEKDPEYVHQLRVGTRRASAALDIFAPCLPDKVYRKARKHLRRLRRAAGAARDWDVFLAEVVEQATQLSRNRRPGLDFLAGYALSQRTTAQEGLELANPDYPFAFERLIAETLHAIAGPQNVKTLLDLARPVLFDFLQRLEVAAARDLSDYHNLHQVRIAGKRLRYAMEVFADCFAGPFREVHYPAVEQMQEMLGRANDSHVACQRLGALGERLAATMPAGWKRYRAGIGGLLSFHQRRLPEERLRFEEWWSAWQKSGGEAAFATLLKEGTRET